MLEVLLPLSLVLAPVGVVEGTLAVSLAQLPVSDVSIPEKLAIGGAVEPDVGSEATLEVVLPVALVLLVTGEPEHGSLPVPLVVGPLAVVVVPAGVSHLALAPLHASLPLALVH